MKNVEIKMIWSGPNLLGECPWWHATEKKLYWVDIVAKALHRLDPLTQDYQSWKMPGFIGCIAGRKKGGLIAGINDEICFIDLPSGNIRPQIKIPGGLSLNDGKCDPQGRFWIGTKDPKNHNACLYRYDLDGKIHKMEENIYISNGLGWSLDHRRMYYTDSLGGKIYTYDFDSKTGAISNRQLFQDIPNEEGEPDGLTLDSQGYIWSARWNGGKVVRYAPNGSIDCEIKMAVQRPTSCIFGGENLDVLYVTSCSRDSSETQTLAPPSGALFAVALAVNGLAEPMFLA